MEGHVREQEDLHEAEVISLWMRGHERVEGKREGLAKKGIGQQLVLRNMPPRLREANYSSGLFIG